MGGAAGMPIIVKAPICTIEQADFARIAYSVMEEAFAIHRRMGRLFDESVYQRELKEKLPGSQIEAPIDVIFESFRKRYEIDLLVERGAIFEIKTVDRFHERHKSQLIHYLMLCGLAHGKLINFRTEAVEHEFVNTSLTRDERKEFSVESSAWIDRDDLHRRFRFWFEAALRDWGVGLDRHLYQQAAIHYFGGEQQSVCSIPVLSNRRTVGIHRGYACGEDSLIEVTTLPRRALSKHKTQLQRLVNHLSVAAIQWLNISLRRLQFETVRRT